GLQWRAAAALLAGLAAPIAPVTLCNAVVGGDLVLISSQGGVNFYIGNNPASDGTTAVVPGTRPTWQGGYEDTIALAREEEGDLLPSGVSRHWFRKGLAFWRQEPLGALLLTARKAVLFFSGMEVSNNKDLTFFRSLSPVLSLPLPGAGLLVPLGLVGWALAAASRPARPVLLLPALILAAYAASIIVFFVTARYRAPVLPLLALGAGLLADRLVAEAAAGRRRAWAVAGAAALLLAVAVNINWFGYRDDPGQGHLALGLAHMVKGEHELALAAFDRSLAAGGPYAYEARRHKGEALAAAGRSADAVDVLAQALQERPDSADALASLLAAAASSGRLDEARALALATVPAAGPQRAQMHFLLGSMAQAVGRAEQAEAHYRQALAGRPGHLGARVNLALLLRGAGRLDQSLAELLAAERLAPASPVVHVNLAKHYLFVGRRDDALRHAGLARRAGAALEPEFERALEAAAGPPR
ncbi:MAG TPA: tetratricopeptide repeat protein, partial [Candidatus Polarisedimenticolia bacterium]|nr:tetratricopeptide repeat protein [Candidatus Polarisedimenticolia bacterium]